MQLLSANRSEGPFVLCDCQSNAANNSVLLFSMELLISSDVKNQNKISLLQSLSVNGPLIVRLYAVELHVVKQS